MLPMKTYVLMLQEKSGEWIAIHHVAIVPCNDRKAVIRYAKERLLAKQCDGRYVGERCVVYCIEDHAFWELWFHDGDVEVLC